MTPADLMATCTARILAGSSDRFVNTGTGFFYEFPVIGTTQSEPRAQIPVLVTNKHVLNGCERANIVLTVAAINAPKNLFGRPKGAANEAFDIPITSETRIDHPSQDVDLCALLVGPLFNSLAAQEKQAHHFVLNQSFQLSAQSRELTRTVEPVAMVGYPNGLWDETNNAPIIRRGITATHPLTSYRGRHEFVIDAACFPGSSGSPVFAYEDGMFRSGENSMSPGTRMALLGILWGGPQFSAEGVLHPEPIPHSVTRTSVTTIPMHLGFVVAADQLDAIGRLIQSRVLI
jgi:hypothetical protein